MTQSPSPPILELRQVSPAFTSGALFGGRQVLALKDFSLTVDAERPTITAVVGESGSGKTTMARLVLGLETPTAGRVLYEGKDLSRLSGAEWREFRRSV